MNPRIKKYLQALLVYCLVITILYSGVAMVDAATPAKSIRFSDVNNHWAQSQITKLASLGLLSGYRDHTYKPDNMINRLEVLVLLAKSAGITPAQKQKQVQGKKTATKKTTGNTKRRVPWGQQYVDAVLEKGFLPEASQADYNFEVPATRIEIAKLLARTLYLVPPSTAVTATPLEEATAENKSSISSFTDYSLISEAERPLLQAVIDANIMSGYPDGTFSPYQPLTRAEIAVILNHLIELGWAKIPNNQLLNGWISSFNITRKTREMELTNINGAKKYNLARGALCYKNGEIWPISMAANYRCDIILDSSKQVCWINLLEKKETGAATEKIRGSIMSIVVGKDSLLAVNDLAGTDHTLPIAWDAVVTGKKGRQDIKSVKSDSFVDLEVYKGQIRGITLLDVKTLSGIVQKYDDGRVYLQSGNNSNKPGWFNNCDFARIVEKDGSYRSSLKKDDKIQVTYLDPYPKEIDDEIPLEIKITAKKK